MKRPIKLILITVIIVVAYFVIARNTDISIFHSVVKTEKKKLLLEYNNNDFINSLPVFKDVSRFGGGNVIMFYDSVQHKTILQSCFISDDNELQIDRTHFQKIVTDSANSNYFFQTPFPFEKLDEKSKKFGSALFERGFYLGLYRELLENVSFWQKKYGSLSISFALTTDSISKIEDVLIYIETKIDGKTEQIAYSFPNEKTKKHIYDFMLTDQSKVSRSQLDILNALNYTYPTYNSAIKNWKINSKKFELRNIKWNFD